MKLSDNEHEVLSFIATGHKTSEIAKLMHLSFETVKTYRRKITSKFGAENTAHAVYLATRMGLICLFAILAHVQVTGQVINLTGYLEGTYIGSAININDAEVDSACFEICKDNFNPAIVLWGDPCIADEEWISDGWDMYVQDSVDFYTQGFLAFMEPLGVYAYDDCALDTFEVYDVVITPPGGISRPPNGTREFNVFFRAIDATGKITEEDMHFRRTEEPYNCN